MIKVAITPGLLEVFRRYRLATSAKGERLRQGEILGLDPDTRIEAYAHLMEGRLLPTALGAFSYSHSPFGVEMAVGRYCSFSWGVELMAVDHPVAWAAMSPFSHYPFDQPGFADYLDDKGVAEFRLHRFDHGIKRTVIGNDVWIGMRVLLKRGITIGHGAVIGAGSVVTRDVPPYAIVAGSPAKLIRHRFPEAVIERFLAAEWWHYGPDVLQPFDVRDPNGFLDRFEEAVAGGIAPLDLPVLTGEEIIAAGEPV